MTQTNGQLTQLTDVKTWTRSNIGTNTTQCLQTSMDDNNYQTLIVSELVSIPTHIRLHGLTLSLYNESSGSYADFEIEAVNGFMDNLTNSANSGSYFICKYINRLDNNGYVALYPPGSGMETWTFFQLLNTMDCMCFIPVWMPIIVTQDYTTSSISYSIWGISL